jgi:hypothetical protein
MLWRMHCLRRAFHQRIPWTVSATLGLKVGACPEEGNVVA